MNRNLYYFLLFLSIILQSCTSSMNQIKQSPANQMSSIDSLIIKSTIDTLKLKYPNANSSDIESGVKQAAIFWMNSDGTNKEFTNFCSENFIASESDKQIAFEKLSKNYEIINGYFNKMSVGLKEPIHLDQGSITPIDQMFGGFSPMSHLSDDFFNTKIAFYISLNFKYYTLAEKTSLGASWNRKQWAMARLSDGIYSRVPGLLIQNFSSINTQSDSYIAEYNIYMGNLVNDKNEKLFPEDLKLISHWGLRDQLKANYSNKQGIERQQMIYSIMKHVIYQDIPSDVINSKKYIWNPISNKIFIHGKETHFNPEPDTRYEWLLKNFRALKKMDPYNPYCPTYIEDKFDHEMEIPQPIVEQLFTSLVGSPQIRKVAKLIEKRLGRSLQPFDIWYDGFKARSAVNTDELDKMIEKKYPNSEAFQKDIPNLLVKLGFKPDKAEYIASKIQIDAARGAGHAWGAEMKGDKAHLRTRIDKTGMNYQSFNVAMHELGHCVEQTISLYDIDYYELRGVPNTAFTEALAFLFQKRDLSMLGYKSDHPNKSELEALDIFWANYEIMGVSLVDMSVWKWLYQNPNATKQELKEAVIRSAKEVWNKYYADVFGMKDQPILAIYSHMIDYPLYLSAYPIGFLIDFQIDKYITGKNFADEIMRIYQQGRIIPQLWMKGAVGEELSNKPLLEAVDRALEKID